jgi:hypothetical protein
MKRTIGFAGILLLTSVIAQSQTPVNKSNKKQHVHPIISPTNGKTGNSKTQSSNTIKLNSIANYPAKATINYFFF